MMALDLPPLFLARMAGLLGDEFPAFLASYQRPAVAGLRVNTLKISAVEFHRLSPFTLDPVPWCPSGFVVPEEEEPGKHPYHAAGLYYLQEPSAMAVAELLDPQPGEWILDLAAAPGGKATHIAARMQGRGLLVANEVHPQRVWELAQNLERWGARHVIITNESPGRLAGRWPAFFDAVLVDAPCSGEGMFRKSAAARREWSPQLVKGCAGRQLAILAQAARLVRPGGKLVYATCTFAPEENEGVVARFLQEHSEFELEEPKRAAGLAAGRPEWLVALENGPASGVLGRPAGSGLDATLQLARAVRLWPHLGPGEGHFIAVLRRHASESRASAVARPWRQPQVPGPVREAYRAFCAGHLTLDPGSQRLALVGSYLYALPGDDLTPDRPDLPDLSGLRFIHPGWWLGSMIGQRFEPSHALALGLRREDARRVLDLPASSPEVRAYLRGEMLSAPGEPGWVLVTVDGFPLGWGRRVAGRVKSRYPKGLRQI